MDAEVTSTPAPEVPVTGQDSGQGEAVPTPGSTPTVPAEIDYSTLDYSKIDLNKHPGFTKQFQPKYQEALRQAQALQAEREQAWQYAQNLQRQVEQMEAHIRQREVESAPDDYGKLEKLLAQREADLNRAQQNYQALLQQQVQERQAAQAAAQARQEYDNTMDKLSTRFGVEREEIEKELRKLRDPDYDAALDIAVTLRDKKREREKEVKAERVEANRVDLGGGKAITPISDLERKYQEAVNDKDSVAMAHYGRLMREQFTKK